MCVIHPSWSNDFADIKGIFCPLGVLYTPSSTVVTVPWLITLFLVLAANIMTIKFGAQVPNWARRDSKKNEQRTKLELGWNIMMTA